MARSLSSPRQRLSAENRRPGALSDAAGACAEAAADSAYGGGSHHFLLVRFLTSAFSIKLEDLADEWFVSRATLQSDMVEVRERFQRYQLTLETRPRHGMKLFGSEVSIRACLTDLLWELAQQGDKPADRRGGAECGCAGAAGAVLQET
jgi:hypothetical protein